MNRAKRSKKIDGFEMEWEEKKSLYVCPMRDWKGSGCCQARARQSRDKYTYLHSHSHSLELLKDFKRLTKADAVDTPIPMKEKTMKKGEQLVFPQVKVQLGPLEEMQKSLGMKSFSLMTKRPPCEYSIIEEEIESKREEKEFPPSKRKVGRPRKEPIIEENDDHRLLIRKRVRSKQEEHNKKRRVSQIFVKSFSSSSTPESHYSATPDGEEKDKENIKSLPASSLPSNLVIFGSPPDPNAPISLDLPVFSDDDCGNAFKWLFDIFMMGYYKEAIDVVRRFGEISVDRLVVKKMKGGDIEADVAWLMGLFNLIPFNVFPTEDDDEND